MIIRKSMIFIMAGLILLTVMNFSCSGRMSQEDLGYERSLTSAMKKFHSGSYRAAIDDFNRIVLNYGGESGIDSVQYYMALSHFKIGEYFSASYEFIRLAERFPESDLAEEAYFMDGESYFKISPRYVLDQKDTHRAIRKYQNYLDLYPRGRFSENALSRISTLREKLARKEFEAGELYMKLNQPRAARVYFSEVINNYYDTDYYTLSLKGVAKAHLDMKEVAEYEEFMRRYKEITDRER